jgi:hypothetical protein
MSKEPIDDAPAPEAEPATDPGTEPARSDGLRSAAFLCTVLAALAVGVGALLTWVTFGLDDPNAHVLDQVYKGVDLAEGLVALGCAVVLLVGTLVFRGLARMGRTVVAVLMIAAGVVAVGAAGATILTANTRLEGQFIDGLTSEAGTPPTGAIRQQLEDRTDTTLGAGIWLTFAGGFLGFVGGTLSLAYAVRLDDDDEGAVAAI